MNKQELLIILKDELGNDDQELAHINADKALLEFIKDHEITDAFNAIDKWYA